MMSFCKRIIRLSDSNSSRESSPSRSCCRNIPSPAGGLSLIAVTSEIHRPANVVECVTVKAKPVSSSSSSSSSELITKAVKRDAGGIGFLDEVGGGVDGLMSCTESLGFESSDERRKDDQMEEEEERISTRSRSTTPRSRWRKRIERVKSFPPPLSSLNRNGQPSFFLKPMRKDGRLELTEVWINRPEILRAIRQDGRLRLQLISSEPHHHQNEDDDEEEEQVIPSVETIQEEEKEEEIVEEEEEENVREWRFPVSTVDGFRRCKELSNRHREHHHHHHNLPLWSNHCVPTR